MKVDEITSAIIGAAIEVHKELGPGLLESAYEHCLTHLLVKRGFKVDLQVTLPVRFYGELIGAGYRIDMLVNDTVIVELKAVEVVNPVFEAQLLSYLKLSGKPIGLLINFHVPKLAKGIKRLINWESAYYTPLTSNQSSESL